MELICHLHLKLQEGLWSMPGNEANFTLNIPAGRLVLGEPVSAGETTLVPVISVGAAYGEITKHGCGGGFTLNPVAVVAIQDRRVSVFSLQHQVKAEKLNPMLSRLLEEITSPPKPSPGGPGTGRAGMN